MRRPPNQESYPNIGLGANAPNINDLKKKKSKAKPITVDPSKIAEVKNPYLTDQMQQISNQQQAIQNRPQVTMDVAQQEQARAQQMQLAQALSLQASGQGPSLAQAQMNQAQDAMIRQQQAQAASMRGGVNPMLLARGMQQQNAISGQQLAQSAGVMRLQEQQAAQQQLANVLQSSREQDIGLAGQQASLGVQQQQFVDQLTNQLMTQGFTLQQAQQMANTEMAQFNAQQNLGKYQAQKGVQAQTSGAKWAAGGAALAGLVGLLSDVRQKEEIKDTDPKEMLEFLDALESKNYKYKNPNLSGASKGERFGIIAQDLEKSKIGKSIVKDTTQGKMVDVNQGYGVVLAALSEMNKRLKKVGG